jgi:hypothetical protein
MAPNILVILSKATFSAKEYITLVPPVGYVLAADLGSNAPVGHQNGWLTNKRLISVDLNQNLYQTDLA